MSPVSPGFSAAADQPSPVSQPLADQLSLDAQPASPSFNVITRRDDAAEIRKLRSRLLKLILENQLCRDSERQRGLTFRGAG